ncbi:hypothetical protein C6P46_005244 [Rhodotorula mucilaginosa]|uniref:Uncharacterized protein n=1 Tax=Rhodotorula mucilaginosa TaxID=5537 RepID=A0A9P6W0Y6_RHOMI|nr:hypothetical protein C6P46_005244 [Rhodotorula mucilaginosa]TKA54440.1 hypothetical protein B0A53_03133 [Rhodotorula sp. CCFEE 5036]
MCIVFFTANDKYSLIVASNRDEFLARPTSQARWHAWDPHHATDEMTDRNRVLSGLDLTAGGTWFGISVTRPPDAAPTGPAKRMHFATLTNFTESLDPALDRNAPPKPSRGNLVREYLDVLNELDFSPLPQPHGSSPATATAEESLEATQQQEDRLQTYLDRIEQVKHDYAGFNLLVGEIGTFDQPAAATPRVRLGYTSNRESGNKRARVLPSLDEPSSPSSSASAQPQSRQSQSPPDETANRAAVHVHVRGLSNATLEVEPGEVEWPKVKSGAAAVEKVVTRLQHGSDEDDDENGEAEEELVKGLYHALSTAHPSPIQHREHLRETVLVEPLCLDPSRPLQAVPPPLPPAPAPAPAFASERAEEGSRAQQAPSPMSRGSDARASSSPLSAPSSTLSSDKNKEGVEGNPGLQWYATRVQTLLLVERKPNGKVIFRERDAYVLDRDGEDEEDSVGRQKETKSRGTPRWSGQERRYEFRL